jgi:hypothetical protein
VSDLVCFFKQKIEERGLSHLQLSLLKSVFLFNNVNSVDNETGPKRILCGVHFCAVVKILSEKERKKASFDFHTVCEIVAPFLLLREKWLLVKPLADLKKLCC